MIDINQKNKNKIKTKNGFKLITNDNSNIISLEIMVTNKYIFFLFTNKYLPLFPFFFLYKYILKTIFK